MIIYGITACYVKLQYEGQLARAISQRIGPRLCLHGASSIAEEQIAHFFEDGI